MENNPFGSLTPALNAHIAVTGAEGAVNVVTQTAKKINQRWKDARGDSIQKIRDLDNQVGQLGRRPPSTPKIVDPNQIKSIRNMSFSLQGLNTAIRAIAYSLFVRGTMGVLMTAMKASKQFSEYSKTVQRAKDAFQKSLQPMGDAAIRVFTPLIKSITGALNAFNNLPEPIKRFVGYGAALATMAATIGLVVTIVKQLQIGLRIKAVYAALVNTLLGIQNVLLRKNAAAAQTAAASMTALAAANTANAAASTVNNLAMAGGGIAGAAGAARGGAGIAGAVAGAGLMRGLMTGLTTVGRVAGRFFWPLAIGMAAFDLFNFVKGSSSDERPQRRSSWENIYSRQFGQKWSG